MLSLQGGLLGVPTRHRSSSPPTAMQDCCSGVHLAHRKKKEGRIDLIAEYDVESQARKEAILLLSKFMRN